MSKTECISRTLMKECQCYPTIKIPTVVSLSHGKNEAEWLPRCLKSINEQTLKPSYLIYIDDGSIDDSLNVAKKFCNIAESYPSSQKHYDILDYTHIANVYNAMFKLLNVAYPHSDYIFIGGCDAIYPLDYLERLIIKMEADPKLVVASGIFRDEPCGERYARGLGRVYKTDFWNKYVKRVPLIEDWETSPLRIAWDNGFKVASFSDMKYDGRPTGERR